MYIYICIRTQIHEKKEEGEEEIARHTQNINSYHPIVVELGIWGCFSSFVSLFSNFCNDYVIFVIKMLVITFRVLHKNRMVGSGGAFQSLNFMI